jgi:hypothetical protein
VGSYFFCQLNLLILSWIYKKFGKPKKKVAFYFKCRYFLFVRGAELLLLARVKLFIRDLLEEPMTIDLLLTGLVVAGAVFYVVRKFMKPGAGCANGCGCSADKKQPVDIIDLRNKEKQD